jgi:hypothetical protein
MTLHSTYQKSWRMLAVAVFCCLMTEPAVGGEPRSAMDKQAVAKQRSPQRTLALYAKDPATWKIRPGGAHGTLNYHEQTGQFSFTARKLKPHSAYLLVRNADAPPTGDLLARGTTNKAGELRLSGRWNDWTNKIWLVSSNDLTISGNRVTLCAWNPELYLFEEKVLGVSCGECDE